MGDSMRLRTLMAAVVLSVLVPGSAAASLPVDPVAVGATVDAGVAAEVAPLPRLRSVTLAGQQYGRLEEVATGRVFVPQGANYVRLTTTPSAHHSTFEPGRYTTAEAEQVLATLARDGYNAVRVFIDHGNATDADTHHMPHGIGRGMTDTQPYYGPYLDNVADFVRLATKHKIRVMFSLDLFPQSKYYYDIVGHVDRSAVNMDGRNLNYLHPTYVLAKSTYMRNFAAGLRERIGAELMSTVLAFGSDNEAYLVGDKAPYNKLSGEVTPLNGVTYQMSDPIQRQLSADASFVEYSNRMVRAVHAVDPAALVTMGMFTFGAVYKAGPQGMPHICNPDSCPPGEYRYPARPSALSAKSQLSFLDIHIYPADKKGVNEPYTLARNLETIEWDEVRGTVLIGEYGASKEHYKQDISAAAAGMREMQVATCQRGFSGWLFWTSNVGDTPALQTYYSLYEEEGAINDRLKPAGRPYVCVRPHIVPRDR
jgi:hypothetical protein